jgi:prepilin-type N-terminal cleavage/methylation domain-containing protein
MRGSATVRRAGFTLIEILAVILIVGILSAVLITQLGDAQDSADGNRTRTRLQMIESIAEEYAALRGEYPPSRFTAEQGVPNDGENVGIEALVVAFYSDKWEAGGHDLGDDALANTDDDLSTRSLTDFGNRKLLELVDAWGNPIAYLHRMDYGADDRIYVTYREDGELLRTPVVARKDPVQGRYFKNTRFQLISAGPDGEFGTEDDITNFETN